MKVLLITRRYPPSIGGKQLYSFDLYTALSKQISVKLVKWGGHNKLMSITVGLAYLFLGSFKALLLDKSIDVIHVPDPILSPLGRMLARLFSKPLIVTVTGLDISHPGRLFQAIVPSSVNRADRVICISGPTAEATASAGINASKIKIISLAVNDIMFGQAKPEELKKELNLSQDSRILLSVGRLVKRKGIAWFIASVMPELVKRYPKLVFVIAGDGEERANIEAAISANGLKEQVLLLGKTDPTLLAKAYNGADVFVMPNIRVPGDMEGFGLVLLEASLCALPVVAAEIEGIKEAVVNDKNGVFVESADAHGFIKAIDGFLKDPAKAKKFGQASRKFSLQHYDWKSVAKEYIETYQEVLNLHK